MKTLRKMEPGRLSLFREYRGLRRDVYVLFFGRMVTSMGSMIWPMLTLILHSKLGMDASEIATYELLFALISIPVSLFGGRLTDRFSKKYVIIFSDVVSVAAFFLCAALPLSIRSMWIFFTAALFQVIERPAYESLVADMTRPEERERAYSLNYLGANLGLVLAPTIGGLLFRRYLWLAFLLNGIFIASSTVLIFLFVRNTHREENEAAIYEAGRETFSLRKVLGENRLLLLYLLVDGFAASIYQQFGYLMPLDLSAAHGADTGAVLFGSITSVNCIVVVTCTALITRRFAGVREVGKMQVGQTLILLGYLLFRVFLGHPWVYYAAIIVFTLGEIFNTLSAGPYLTKRTPASHRGRLFSVSTVVQQVFAAGFLKLIGWLYDAKGSAFSWAMIFALGLTVLLLERVLSREDRLRYPALYE